jgi:uncharacterized repeat protein (TIGR03803 family)
MKSIPHRHLANRKNALNKKDHKMKSNKFGCGLALALLITVGGAHAKSTETTLYSFTGGADGSGPYAGLIEDKSGNLYGTTLFGGANSYGTVFKVTPSGTETVLYSFDSTVNGVDGFEPYAGVIEDKSGNLYGTTYLGGAHDGGTVFELAPNGTEKVLYSFTGGADGLSPFAGLIRKKGKLYGTTVEGGAHGDGTVFEVTPGGKEKVLHSFTGGADGAYPEAGVIMDKTGNLYGTTPSGGAGGLGTVFEVAPDGTETVLHSFTGSPDGKGPGAGLIMDKKGQLYGTTVFGGANNQGTVFELAPDGTETVLYSFTGGADGGLPQAGLIMDKKGSLYGTTEGGGNPAYNGGTVFELAPDGTETVLYSFTVGADGGLPTAGLIEKAGNLYGTTQAGGAGGGTVFKVTKH